MAAGAVHETQQHQFAAIYLVVVRQIEAVITTTDIAQSRGNGLRAVQPLPHPTHNDRGTTVGKTAATEERVDRSDAHTAFGQCLYHRRTAVEADEDGHMVDGKPVDTGRDVRDGVAPGIDLEEQVAVTQGRRQRVGLSEGAHGNGETRRKQEQKSADYLDFHIIMPVISRQS